MDRCALFVDAGYLLADGAMAVHGTRHRESVSWDYPGLLQLISGLARERTGLPLLRCYWYEATIEGRRTPDHDVLADIPGLKLRLSRIRPGRREGVDAQVHRDLMTLARNNAICDAVVVSGDEDLTQVICDAQDLGVRLTVVHIAAEGSWAASRSLRQECDDLIELSAGNLRSYVSLVSGVAESHSGPQPVSNGHGAHSLPPAATPSPLPAAPAPGSLPPAPASTGSHAAPRSSGNQSQPANPPPARAQSQAPSLPTYTFPSDQLAQPQQQPQQQSQPQQSQPQQSQPQQSQPQQSQPQQSQPQQPAAPATGSIPQQSPTTGQFSSPSSAGTYQPTGAYSGPQPAPVQQQPATSSSGATTLADAVKAAHREGHDFGESVARDAPALWLEAVLARKPRMPSDLEARLLQGSSLPIDFLLHDEVRHALRRGFWDALERARS